MNPIHILVFFFSQRMVWHVFNLCVLALVSWVLVKSGVPYIDYVMWISLIIVATIVIWRAGDFFQPAASYIQKKHQIPESVKAAIIDAIASSFPEFCVAVIAVIILGRAEVGVSSIVGSALYNVLIIPAAAGLVAKDPMRVNREVVWRDNLYYIGVVVLLLAALSFPQFSAIVENPQENTQYWGILVALIFIAAYVVLLLQGIDHAQSRCRGGGQYYRGGVGAALLFRRMLQAAATSDGVGQRLIPLNPSVLEYAAAQYAEYDAGEYEWEPLLTRLRTNGQGWTAPSNN